MSPTQLLSLYPLLMGAVAGAIEDVRPAAEIMDDMMTEAVEALTHCHALIVAGAGSGSARARL